MSRSVSCEVNPSASGANINLKVHIQATKRGAPSKSRLNAINLDGPFTLRIDFASIIPSAKHRQRTRSSAG